MPEEDIRVGERETYAAMGKMCTEDKFGPVVCTTYLLSAPQVQRPTHDRASLVSALHPLTLLGWKAGGSLGIMKDGKSDKSTSMRLKRWLSG